MKRTHPELIKELIDKVMLQGENRQTVLEQRACYLWPEVVGPSINRYTFRRYVDKGVMHVYLSSPSLKNELSFYRKRLVDALNKAIGSDIITDLQFH